ncbi:MAG TPA: hypothetical protein VGE07_31350 [Herpetosiphonaceae bacterium]
MKKLIGRLIGIGLALSLLAGGCSVCVQTGGTPPAYADELTPTPTPTVPPFCSSPGCGGGGFQINQDADRS